MRLQLCTVGIGQPRRKNTSRHFGPKRVGYWISTGRPSNHVAERLSKTHPAVVLFDFLRPGARKRMQLVVFAKAKGIIYIMFVRNFLYSYPVARFGPSGTQRLALSDAILR